MSVGDRVELPLQRGKHVGMSMPRQETAAPPEPSMYVAVGIDKLDTADYAGDGRAAMDLTVKEICHGFLG